MDHPAHHGSLGAAVPPGDLSEDLRDATRTAVAALEERVRSCRWMLSDPAVYRVADPEVLRSSVERDEEAVRVLRSALGD
ncbi:MAG: hypothetical protein AVDCRST_MAG36-67 [uncultured Nocardioidaceae bacterium]|uniref:Uncharacterized protein n=1 Tax=uncultured Nocardioidaceae bacterium TaxID=253824 RepID=A0A6J4KV27_9ACTN|nr:MAG: hypothetical protein AVDCRST_MAG36-67 [uncultured Nocardioidaceae bacterium]